MEERDDWNGVPLERVLATGLTPEARYWVERIAQLGRRRGEAVYLVGGLVRDLLLGLAHRDLDVTIEGDSCGFADALAVEVGGRVLRHAEFRTAVFTATDGFEIDLVTARRESYPSPASLPRVERGDLATDLRRRDFAANALAIRLSPGEPLVLIDSCGGIADLESRSLRVLHGRSFRDDPTRILRGVRLEGRLGFRLEAETEQLARAAVAEGIFSHLSGSRLRHELALLLEEPGLALPGLARIAELGVLTSLLPAGEPALRWTSVVERDLLRAEELLAGLWARPLRDSGLRRWRLLWMLLVRTLGVETAIDRAQRRLLFEGADARVLLGFAGRLARTKRGLGSGGSLPRPHVVAEALGGASGEDLALLLLDADPVARAAAEVYLTSLRGIRLTLRGADLLAQGVPPGPALGATLRAVLRARWDGEIGESQELAYALTHVSRGEGEEVEEGSAPAGIASRCASVSPGEGS